MWNVKIILEFFFQLFLGCILKKLNQEKNKTFVNKKEIEAKISIVNVDAPYTWARGE